MGGRSASPLQGLRKAGWAVLDQGAFSAAHFAVNVLVAKALTPQGLGVFAISYVMLWLLVGIHGAWIADPVMIFAPGRHRDISSDYIRAAAIEHIRFIVVSTGLAAVIAITAWFAGSRTIAMVAVGVAASSAGLLTAVAMRRLCLALLRPRLAGLASLGYAVLVVGGTGAASATHALSLVSSFAVIGLAGGVVAIAVASVLRIGNPWRSGPELRAQVVRDHWGYARWALPTAVVAWVPSNAAFTVVPLLPVFADPLAVSGSLRAAFNLIMPALQLNGTIGTFLVSVLAERKKRGAATHLAPIYGALIGLSILYGAGIVLAADSIQRWIYAGRYPDLQGLLGIMVLLPITTAVLHVQRASALAGEHIRATFGAYAVAAAVTLLGIYPLAWLWGARGVALDTAIATAAAVAVLWHHGRRRRAPLR